MQFTDKTSNSIVLVRLIGIPGICKPTTNVGKESIPNFLSLAEQNKIPLLFLETAAYDTKNQNIQHILSQYRERRKNASDLIAFTANLFEKIGVRYTFFKTLKPFPYTPSDVDVLLWSDNSLKIVAKALKNQGCIPLEKNAYGVTMFSQKYKMNIDLTTQIAVSGLVYLNKELLFDNVSRLEVYEMQIQTLEPSADLLVVAAHSIFKEQMYTLSDYYTFTMLLQHWKEAIKLAEKFHIKHALETVLKMTMATTLIAFGPTNPLTKKFEEIGVVNTAKLFSQNFELPKKYDLTTLAVAFFKKIKDDPVSMKSLSHMARSASNFSFYRKIMEHVARKTY